jgi:hypothetical protein
MKKTNITSIVAGLVLGATFTLIPQAPAADPAAPASPAAPAVSPGHSGAEKESPGRKLPFHGKLAAFSEADRTITLTLSTGEKTYHLTPGTEIFRNEKPATLADAVVGEPVSGAYHRNGDRMEITKLTLGRKGDPAESGPGKDPHAKPVKHSKKDKEKNP